MIISKPIQKTQFLTLTAFLFYSTTLSLSKIQTSCYILQNTKNGLIHTKIASISDVPNAKIVSNVFY